MIRIKKSHRRQSTLFLLPISPKICHLAESLMASQRAGGLVSDGNGVPSICIAHGNLMPLACTMYPTKANIAMRPCLISEWRRKPMVASLPCPQKSASARFRGSKKPTIGLSFFARDSRSACDENNEVKVVQLKKLVIKCSF